MARSYGMITCYVVITLHSPVTMNSKESWRTQRIFTQIISSKDYIVFLPDLPEKEDVVSDLAHICLWY